jgi:hypothetical protein
MRLPGRLIRGSVRPDRGSLARFASLRWAALPIVDRRWTAPMSAIALGFGLFVGVAIGPGTEGSFGTTGPMVIRVPMPEETQTAQAPSPPRNGGKPEQPSSPPPSPGGGGEPTGEFPEAPAPPPVLETPPPAPPVTTTPPLPEVPTTTTETPTTTTGETETEGAEGGSTEPEDSTTVLAGTVAHLNPHAASYTIATEDGTLRAIHSRKRPPAIGKRVEVEVSPLANGTYNESGKRSERGSRGRVSFAGTVSFRDEVTGAYTVSGPGASLLVRGGAQRTPPQVGERVEVGARIADHPEPLPVSSPGEQGCGQPPSPPKPPMTALEQVGVVKTEGEAATSVELEAIVQGVCRSERKLIVSADDLRESGRDIGIAIPDTLRIAALKPGQVLKLTATVGDSGALTLTAVAGDERKRGAEDPDLVQPTAGEAEKTTKRR